jgi:hypothetical protein
MTFEYEYEFQGGLLVLFSHNPRLCGTG